MRFSSKFAAAAAASLSLAAFASSASAVELVKIASYSEAGSGRSLAWDGNTTGAGSGELSTIGTQLVDLKLFGLDGALLGTFQANFTLDASAAAGSAVGDVGGGIIRQMGLTGDFAFTLAGGPAVINGVDIATGGLLFGGSFSNGWLAGNATSGSTSGSTFYTGGDVNFVSPVFSFLSDNQAASFSISMDGFSPSNGFNVTNGSLDDFSAFSGGSYSMAVPEPGTWALMILGFGGAGAMIRSRRRALATAA